MGEVAIRRHKGERMCNKRDGSHGEEFAKK